MNNGEKYAQLKAYIDENREGKGILISVLHRAQALFGELNEDVQKFVADELSLPLVDVYGVATFYAQFTLEQKGKYIIGVCMGTTCYVLKAQEIMDEIQAELGIELGQTTDDGLFTLEAPRCIGACGLAPLVSINDEIYGKLVPGQITEIIRKYKAMG